MPVCLSGASKELIGQERPGAPLCYVEREASLRFMKIAGFLLLIAGWLLVLAALALLRPAGPRAAFVLAGVAVELLALVLAFRAHLVRRRTRP